MKEKSMIEVEDLRYTYPQARRPAVDGISFRVDPGEIFGFLGPSGAGKSTTQKILIGLAKGWEGRARAAGRDLRTTGRDYYEGIGVSFELPNLYGKLTALENLRFFASLYKKRGPAPEDLLEAVGLADAGDRRVSDFSKGMKIRLNVCRALVNDPGLLFLDEPTSGQDPVSARRVRDLMLAQKAAGKTIFLTTHNMALAQEICDRVAFVVDGRIVLIDSPRALTLAHGKRSVLVEARGMDGGIDAARFPLDGIGADEAFLALLRSGRVETIHTEEADLDDVFVAATGRTLSDGGGAA